MTVWEVLAVLIVASAGAYVAFAWGRFRRTVLHELRRIRGLLERRRDNGG